jgi:hypothetical protein
MEPKGGGVLDTPLEPVIGLAEGETRWRGMTSEVVERARLMPWEVARPPDCVARDPGYAADAVAAHRRFPKTPTWRKPR